jgi:hypothetical protein
VRKAYLVLWLGSAQHPASARNGRKKSQRTNGLLAIELITAACFFAAQARTTAESVAAYLADLSRDLQALGYEQVTLYLARNSTHRAKMQQQYAALTADLPIKMRFVHFAAYSPALNVVEYGIHWFRPHSLHHQSCHQRLVEVEDRLAGVVKQGIFTPEQIINILSHIEGLFSDKQNKGLSPERE